MAKAGKTDHPKEIAKAIKELSLANEEKIMGTLAEYWKPQIIEKASEKLSKELLEKALIKSRHEQAIDTAKTLLSQGIDLSIISCATKLPKEEIKRLIS